ncbi:hypothetical protein AAHC03_05006 [Spirometra sp. Aus1]
MSSYLSKLVRALTAAAAVAVAQPKCWVTCDAPLPLKIPPQPSPHARDDENGSIPFALPAYCRQFAGKPVLTQTFCLCEGEEDCAYVFDDRAAVVTTTSELLRLRHILLSVASTTIGP